jgi:hypothetical protein
MEGHEFNCSSVLDTTSGRQHSDLDTSMVGLGLFGNFGSVARLGDFQGFR